MTTFSYRCMDREGEVLVGTIDAVDRSVAVEELHKRGMVPLDLSSSGPTLLMRLNEPIDFLSRPSGRDVFAFMRDLSRLLTAGLSIDASFKLLVGMQKKEGFKRTLEDMRERLRRGESLAAAMTVHNQIFQVQVTAAVQAGESSGTLAASLATIATSMDKALSFQERLRGALIYPAILMVMVAGTFFLVLTFVLPQFAPMFEGNEDKLPMATRFVMAIGDWFADYWGLVLLALFGFFAWIMIVRRDKRIRAKVMLALCQVPLMKTWLVTPDVIRFVRTLGVCSESGLALDKAISMAIDAVKIPHVGEQLMKVRTEVRRGELLSTTLARIDWFPNLALQFVLVGEQSGKLGSMLGESAGILAQDYETRLEKGLGVLSPLITLVMGAVVALLIGAVLLGIMSVNDVAF